MTDMQVTQERIETARDFPKLVGLVFCSVIREKGLDPASGKAIAFTDTPVFSDNELCYSTGDCVVAWDDHWVLAFKRDGMPYVGCRTEKGWSREEA